MPTGLLFCLKNYSDVFFPYGTILISALNFVPDYFQHGISAWKVNFRPFEGQARHVNVMGLKGGWCFILFINSKWEV